MKNTRIVGSSTDTKRLIQEMNDHITTIGNDYTNKVKTLQSALEEETKKAEEARQKAENSMDDIEEQRRQINEQTLREMRAKRFETELQTAKTEGINASVKPCTDKILELRETVKTVHKQNLQRMLQELLPELNSAIEDSEAITNLLRRLSGMTKHDEYARKHINDTEEVQYVSAVTLIRNAVNIFKEKEGDR